MRVCATVLAAAAVTGCAAKGDGLVIRFEGAEAAVMGQTITYLELFVGKTGPDPVRRARDFDADRDVFELEVGTQLEGYTVYLRADRVPADIEVIAVLGYEGDPRQGAVPVVMGRLMDPPFVPGELYEVPVTLEAVVARGAAAATTWVERWGAEPVEPVASHACLAWGAGILNTPEGEIVRADDWDCDGTVPPVCDLMQVDRLLLEGDADVDGDGYNVWSDAACAACLVREDPGSEPRPVMCDCDETTPLRHVGMAERCDGLDNDCNDATAGDLAGPMSLPCQIANPGMLDCNMGVKTCVETGGVVETQCMQQVAQHVECLGMDGCVAPTDCALGLPAPTAQLNMWQCTQVRGMATLCGVAPIQQLFPQVPIPAPASCSAVLWAGQERSSGWKLELLDRVTGDRGAALFGRGCDQLAIIADSAPPADLSRTVVILVISDGQSGAPVAVVPLEYRIYNTDASCDAVSNTVVCARN